MGRSRTVFRHEQIRLAQQYEYRRGCFVKPLHCRNVFFGQGRTGINQHNAQIALREISKRFGRSSRCERPQTRRIHEDDAIAEAVRWQLDDDSCHVLRVAGIVLLAYELSQARDFGLLGLSVHIRNLHFRRAAVRDARWGSGNGIDPDWKHLGTKNVIQERGLAGAHAPEYRDLETVGFELVQNDRKRGSKLD